MPATHDVPMQDKAAAEEEKGEISPFQSVGKFTWLPTCVCHMVESPGWSL